MPEKPSTENAHNLIGDLHAQSISAPPEQFGQRRPLHRSQVAGEDMHSWNAQPPKVPQKSSPPEEHPIVHINADKQPETVIVPGKKQGDALPPGTRSLSRRILKNGTLSSSTAPNAHPAKPPASVKPVTNPLPSEPHTGTTATTSAAEDAEAVVRDTEGLSRTASVGVALLPAGVGAATEAYHAAKEGKSKKEILKAGGHGALNGGLGIDEYKKAVSDNPNLTPVDRTIAGLKGVTATTATGLGVAGAFTAGATLPAAGAAGLANTALGVVQDLAHWTHLANEKGTIEHTYDALKKFQELSDKNGHEMAESRKDPLGTYKKALESGNEAEAQSGLAVYQHYILMQYTTGKLSSGGEQGRFSDNDDLNGKNAAKKAAKLAQNLYDDAARRRFHPTQIASQKTAKTDMHHDHGSSQPDT